MSALFQFHTPTLGGSIAAQEHRKEEEEEEEDQTKDGQNGSNFII